MITLTAAATNALRQQGARIVYDVSVGAPVSENLTGVVKSIPAIRSSVRPLERVPEIGSLSILLDNADNRLSTWNASGVFGSKKWSGALVTVQLGVELAPMRRELVTVFVGDLDNVVETIPSETVEIVCVDPFSRLKHNDVDGSFQGTEYISEVPSFIVKKILENAGYTSRMATATFDSEIAAERSEGAKVRSYTIPEGKWMTPINEMLKHTNAGLRLDRNGNIELYKYRPTSAGSLVTLRTNADLGPITVEKPSGDIINSYGVRRKDFDGNDVVTVNSPIEDAQSKTDYGKIGDALNTLYAIDPPAESIALERLGSKSQPPLIVSAPASIDHFPIELWDEITILDEGGFSASGIVFDKNIEHGSVRTSLKMFTTALNTKSWLFCDNSQQLDDAQLVF